MNSDTTVKLTVQVAQRGNKYAWQLYSPDHYQPIKYSVPIFLSQDAAQAAGEEVLARYLARSAARQPSIKRIAEIKALLDSDPTSGTMSAVAPRPHQFLKRSQQAPLIG